MSTLQSEKWTPQQSADIYQIDRWGEGFFRISDDGQVHVFPDPEKEKSWNLVDIVNQGLAQNLAPPVLIRLPGVIRSKVQQLYSAFGDAISKYGYQSSYTLMFPIKVNQNREVLDAVQSAKFDTGNEVGLEAGSKAELLAAICNGKNDTPIFCNGFKDESYIELATRAYQLGRRIRIIIEKPHEIDMVARCAEKLNCRPPLGVRVKLASRVGGRWQSSAGTRSKFGLSTSQLIDAVDHLKELNLLDRLEVLHFHPGSQINNVRHIKAAIIEATRVYADLVKNGVPLKTIDVGGGLAVDYTGNRNTQASSMNYTLQEYANDVVYYIQLVCKQTGVPHPQIVSESGRAVSAHHGILVVPVLGAGQATRSSDIELSDEELKIPALYELQGTLTELNENNVLESYHDGQQAVEMALQLFSNGHLTLEQRVKAERIFYALCQKVRSLLDQLEFVPAELNELQTVLADTYYANFSLFQSLPDNWAIDHLFPLMPIHRLSEKPTRRGTVGDITCDSDGCIDHFIGPNGGRKTLPLHPLSPEQPYWIGIFLVGAYQEVLGDYHNLLGRLHVLTADWDEEGELSVSTRQGTLLGEALELVNHSEGKVAKGVRALIQKATKEQRVTPANAQSAARFFQQIITQYTYLTEELKESVADEVLSHSAQNASDVAVDPIDGIRPAEGTLDTEKFLESIEAKIETAGQPDS